MKLVIEMDEHEYKEILKDGNINFLRIIKAIKNGTPLPNGRLIDGDALYKEVASWGMNDYEPSDFLDEIDRTPTIIEKEGRNDSQ